MSLFYYFFFIAFGRFFNSLKKIKLALKRKGEIRSKFCAWITWLRSYIWVISRVEYSTRKGSVKVKVKVKDTADLTTHPHSPTYSTRFGLQSLQIRQFRRWQP